MEDLRPDPDVDLFLFPPPDPPLRYLVEVLDGELDLASFLRTFFTKLSNCILLPFFLNPSFLSEALKLLPAIFPSVTNSLT